MGLTGRKRDSVSDLTTVDSFEASIRTKKRGRFMIWCWTLALAVHVAWVPNLVWFMVVPPQAPNETIEVSLATVPGRQPAPPNPGRAARGMTPPDIELPGMAPGGRSAHIASPRLERPREALYRTQSWAPRALDVAPIPQRFQPHSRNHERSPEPQVATPDPSTDDIRLNGPRSRDDSLIRHRGEYLIGPPRAETGSGGRPSAGNRVPRGDGELAAAAAGDGEGETPRAARRGARPRSANPAVSAGPSSTDAPRRGRLGGMTPSRQVYPVLAASDPVREARIASGPGREFENGAAVRQRPGPGGASREPRGPGAGGHGVGSDGAGSSSGVLFQGYLRDARTQITRHWGDFPPDLAIDLQQGLVVLAIRVRHDGRIERVSVRRSSGFEQFDTLAVRAVRDANPLPPPPPEVLFRNGRNYLVLDLPMGYRNPMFE